MLCQPSHHGVANSGHWIEGSPVSTFRNTFNWDLGEPSLCPSKLFFSFMVTNFDDVCIRGEMHVVLSCPALSSSISAIGRKN